MSDDLFGNISSDEDEVISKEEDDPKPVSSEVDKAKAAQLLLDELSDDSDDSDEDIQPTKGKVSNFSLDDEEDEEGEQVFDKQTKIDKPAVATVPPPKKISDTISRKKNILFSEMNVPSRRVSLEKESSKPFFVKLPKFVKIANDAFNPETYDAEAERSKYEAASAVVRWTSDPSNPQHILSNAALVQYDDGSFELVVGDNVFNAKVAPAENCFIFEQAKCSQLEKRHPNADKKSNGDASQEDKSPVPCTCLVCCGPINNRFIFEPTSLDSAAHHRIHFSVRNQDANQQEKKIGTMDLEKLHETQAINQKQFEKLDEKRRSVARQKKRAAESQPRRFVAHHRPYMSSQYLEGDEYEDDYYDDDEEDEGKLVERPKKIPPPKKSKKRRSDSDDDEGESVGHDGDDMSVDDENDHGSDLDDFIEKDNDDGDEDVEALDEDSAADEESEEEEDDEEAEAEDEEDDEDEESGMSGEDDDDEDIKKKSKKGKDSRKEKKKDKKHAKDKSKKHKKDKLRKDKKVKKDESDEDIEADRSESKKRKRSRDSEDEEKEKTSSQAESSEKSAEITMKDALQDEEDDEDEEVIVHQSKKQRKVLLDSDEDE